MSLKRFASSLASRPAGAAPSSHWGWAAAGAVLGVLVCCLVFAPARWLSGWLHQASSGQILLQDARGSIWTGSASLSFAGGAGSQDITTLAGRLQWKLRPSLLSGLTLQLSSDCCIQQPWKWQVVPRWGGVDVSLSDGVSNWPAQMLSGLGTPWNTVDARGQLLLTTHGLSFGWSPGRLTVTGKAQLQALDMSSRLSTLRPMGSYSLTLNGGATPGLQLSTLRGALQLSGGGEWVAGKLYFSGQASSAPESLAALSNLLNILGKREGDRSILSF